MDEVGGGLHQVQEPVEVGRPVGQHRLGALRGAEPDHVAGAVDLGIQVPRRHHVGELGLEAVPLQAQQLRQARPPDAGVVPADDAKVVLDRPAVERVDPVPRQLVAALQQGRSGLEGGLVRQRVLDDLLLEEQLDRLPVRPFVRTKKDSG